MNNLLVDAHKQEVLARIDRLQAGAKAQWGKMNVNQALRHMAMGFDITTGVLDPTVAKVPPIPKWLLKFFLLNMKPPKGGAETFKEINMVANNIDPAEFEVEKENLKKTIRNFTAAGNFIAENKLVGKFTKDEWGKLNFNHCDHHLRQFGV